MVSDTEIMVIGTTITNQNRGLDERIYGTMIDVSMTAITLSETIFEQNMQQHQKPDFNPTRSSNQPIEHHTNETLTLGALLFS